MESAVESTGSSGAAGGLLADAHEASFCDCSSPLSNVSRGQYDDLGEAAADKGPSGQLKVHENLLLAQSLQASAANSPWQRTPAADLKAVPAASPSQYYTPAGEFTPYTNQTYAGSPAPEYNERYYTPIHACFTPQRSPGPTPSASAGPQPEGGSTTQQTPARQGRTPAKSPLGTQQIGSKGDASRGEAQHTAQPASPAPSPCPPLVPLALSPVITTSPQDDDSHPITHATILLQPGPLAFDTALQSDADAGGAAAHAAARAPAASQPDAAAGWAAFASGAAASHGAVIVTTSPTHVDADKGGDAGQAAAVTPFILKRVRGRVDEDAGAGDLASPGFRSPSDALGLHGPMPAQATCLTLPAYQPADHTPTLLSAAHASHTATATAATVPMGGAEGSMSERMEGVVGDAGADDDAAAYLRGPASQASTSALSDIDTLSLPDNNLLTDDDALVSTPAEDLVADGAADEATGGRHGARHASWDAAEASVVSDACDACDELMSVEDIGEPPEDPGTGTRTSSESSSVHGSEGVHRPGSVHELDSAERSDSVPEAGSPLLGEHDPAASVVGAIEPVTGALSNEQTAGYGDIALSADDDTVNIGSNGATCGAEAEAQAPETPRSTPLETCVASSSEPTADAGCAAAAAAGRSPAAAPAPLLVSSPAGFSRAAGPVPTDSPSRILNRRTGPTAARKSLQGGVAAALQPAAAAAAAQKAEPLRAQRGRVGASLPGLGSAAVAAAAPQRRLPPFVTGAVSPTKPVRTSGPLVKRSSLDGPKPGVRKSGATGISKAITAPMQGTTASKRVTQSIDVSTLQRGAGTVSSPAAAELKAATADMAAAAGAAAATVVVCVAAADDTAQLGNTSQPAEYPVAPSPLPEQLGDYMATPSTPSEAQLGTEQGSQGEPTQASVQHTPASPRVLPPSKLPTPEAATSRSTAVTAAAAAAPARPMPVPPPQRQTAAAATGSARPAPQRKVVQPAAAKPSQLPRGPVAPHPPTQGRATSGKGGPAAPHPPAQEAPAAPSGATAIAKAPPKLAARPAAAGGRAAPAAKQATSPATAPPAAAASTAASTAPVAPLVKPNGIPRAVPSATPRVSTSHNSASSDKAHAAAHTFLKAGSGKGPAAVKGPHATSPTGRVPSPADAGSGHSEQVRSRTSDTGTASRPSAAAGVAVVSTAAAASVPMQQGAAAPASTKSRPFIPKLQLGALAQAAAAQADPVASARMVPGPAASSRASARPKVPGSARPGTAVSKASPSARAAPSTRGVTARPAAAVAATARPRPAPGAATARLQPQRPAAPARPPTAAARPAPLTARPARSNAAVAAASTATPVTARAAVLLSATPRVTPGSESHRYMNAEAGSFSPNKPAPPSARTPATARGTPSSRLCNTARAKPSAGPTPASAKAPSTSRARPSESRLPAPPPPLSARGAAEARLASPAITLKAAAASAARSQETPKLLIKGPVPTPPSQGSASRGVRPVTRPLTGPKVTPPVPKLVTPPLPLDAGPSAQGGHLNEKWSAMWDTPLGTPAASLVVQRQESSAMPLPWATQAASEGAPSSTGAQSALFGDATSAQLGDDATSAASVLTLPSTGQGPTVPLSIFKVPGAGDTTLPNPGQPSLPFCSPLNTEPTSSAMLAAWDTAGTTTQLTPAPGARHAAHHPGPAGLPPLSPVAAAALNGAAEPEPPGVCASPRALPAAPEVGQSNRLTGAACFDGEGGAERVTARLGAARAVQLSVLGRPAVMESLAKSRNEPLRLSLFQ